MQVWKNRAIQYTEEFKTLDEAKEAANRWSNSNNDIASIIITKVKRK